MRGREEKRVRGKGVVPCCVSLSHNNYNAASPPLSLLLSLLQNVHEVYWLLLISVCTHIFIYKYITIITYYNISDVLLMLHTLIYQSTTHLSTTLITTHIKSKDMYCNTTNQHNRERRRRDKRESKMFPLRYPLKGSLIPSTPRTPISTEEEIGDEFVAELMSKVSTLPLLLPPLLSLSLSS